jgi:hypothetical protein
MPRLLAATKLRTCIAAIAVISAALVLSSCKGLPTGGVAWFWEPEFGMSDDMVMRQDIARHRAAREASLKAERERKAAEDELRRQATFPAILDFREPGLDPGGNRH